MDDAWNKRRLTRLTQGDAEIAQSLLSEYIGVIYTWMFYNTAGDAETAADLTGQTFCKALENITHFDLSRDSLYQWLKDQARQVRDEGLAARGGKPQRPAEWSKLSPATLKRLSLLRSEVLPDETLSIPAVLELVQAALTELEPADRTLMMHRYNRLETPPQIAEELGLSVEEVEDRLYRCRHSFRRVFNHLIASANEGFAEAGNGGTIEVLDTNMEKLLSAVAMTRTPSPKDIEIIRVKVLKIAEDLAKTQAVQPAKRSVPIIWIAAVIAAILLLAGIVLLATKSRPGAQPPKPTGESTKQPTSSQTQTSQPGSDESISEDDIKRILEYGRTGDLKELIEIFKAGTFPIKMIAAFYIGEIGDEASIGLLEEAEAEWFPNGPADNAFAKAIAQIEQRLAAEHETVIEEVVVPEEMPEEIIEEPATPETPLPETPPAPVQAVPEPGGTVRDFSGQGIANAVIEIRENPLLDDAAGRTLSQSRTGADGRYKIDISGSFEGPVFIDCTAAPDNTMNFTRAVLYTPKTPLKADFGGMPPVTGVIHTPAAPLAGEIVLLSDALDPANAAFRAETITDETGGFSFWGVPAGLYYLLHNTPDNRIARLTTAGMSATASPLNLNVDIPETTLTVQINGPQDFPMPDIVSVTYGADISRDFEEFLLTPAEDTSYTLTDQIPMGSYTVSAQFRDGMRLYREIEITGGQTSAVFDIPEPGASLSGRFLSPSPLRMFLYTSDQQLRYMLQPDNGGTYVVNAAAGIYSLGVSVHNLLVEVSQIDLLNESESVLDIDPDQIIRSFSPLYVVVTDDAGMLISGAEVWITGAGGSLITTQSTGRGAFLAAPAGEYALFAVTEGYSPKETPVELKPGSLQDKPNPGNTVVIRLSR